MFGIRREYKLAKFGPNAIPYTVLLGPPNGYYPMVNDQLNGYRQMINQGFDPKQMGRPLISISNLMGYQSPMASIATPSGCNRAVLQNAIVKVPRCGNPEYWSVPYLTKPITLKIEQIGDATKTKSVDIVPQAIRTVLDKITPYQIQPGTAPFTAVGLIGYNITVPNYPDIKTIPMNLDQRKALFGELEKLGFTGLFDYQRTPVL